MVGFGVPVLIVGRCDPGSHPAVIDAGVDTTVYDADGVDDTADAAARSGRRARVHVKIDTGMGRLGVQPQQLDELLRLIGIPPSPSRRNARFMLCGGQTN